MKEAVVLIAAAIWGSVGGSEAAAAASSSMGFRLEEQGMLTLNPAHPGNYNTLGAVETGQDALVLGRRSPNMAGSVWSKTRLMHSDWYVQMRVRITGDRLGGEGLALWYVKDMGEGPVFGAPDRWTGLGIILDTFDDDGHGNNPAIMGILNDGSMQYSAKADGEGQYFGGCLRNVKNINQPLFLRVTYMQGNIKVELDDSKDGKEFVNCFEKNLGSKLPPGYHFGISGATNALPDSLEILDMRVWAAVPADLSVPPVVAGDQGAAKAAAGEATVARVESRIDGESLIKSLEGMLQTQLRTFMPQIIGGHSGEAVRKAGEKDARSHQQLLQQIDPRLHGIEESLGHLHRQVQSVIEHLNRLDPNHLQPVLNQHMDDLRDRIEVLRSESHHHINSAVRDGHLGGGRWARIGGWVAMAIVGQVGLLTLWLVLKRRAENHDKKWM